MSGWEKREGKNKKRYVAFREKQMWKTCTERNKI